MGSFRAMRFEDRSRLLSLLQRIEGAVVEGDSYIALVMVLIGELRTWIPHADLNVGFSSSCVSFSAVDGETYFANGAGLWVEGRGAVSARDWWFAVLKTRRYFLELRRVGVT